MKTISTFAKLLKTNAAMACTEEEFLELLSDESTVDIVTLTEQAKYGIPDKVGSPRSFFFLLIFVENKNPIYFILFLRPRAGAA